MTSNGEALGAYETIRVTVDAAGIVTCVIDRQAVRNALNLQMVRELDGAMTEIRSRSDVRAVIFTGAGERAFVGGADIAELCVRDRYDALRFINNGLFRTIETLQVPTLAAIRGYALGGGCELALACDMRICGESAKLGQPEVGLGIIPGAGATYRLTRVVGRAMARELIFTGRIIDAPAALGMGLVNRVVADDAVLQTARDIAQQIAGHSPLAVRFAKLCANAVDEMSVDACMTLEATAQAVLFEDDEKKARMAQFLERRRKPRHESTPV